MTSATDLIASERRLQALLQNSLDGMLLLDATGKIVLVPTPRAAAILGAKVDDLIGRSIWEMIHPDDLDFTAGLFRDLIREEGKQATGEIRCRRNDGSWRWLEFVSGNLLTDPAVGAVVVNVRDITDCKELEEQRRASENRLDLFFSQSLDGFFFMMLDQPVQWDESVDQEAVLDYVFAHQRITKVNDAFLAQYGATKDQVMGMTPNDFFRHNVKTGRELWRQMFVDGRLHTKSEERKLDGTPIWIEGDYTCIYDSRRRIAGHFGIQRDVTEAVNSVAILQASKEFAQSIINNSLDMIIAVDLERRIMEFNAAAEKVFGYQRAEIMGRSADLLYANGPNGIEVNRETVNQGQCVKEVLNRRKNGETFYSLLSASVLRNTDGEPVGVMGVSRDITEQKHAQEILKCRTDQIAVVARALGTFLETSDWQQSSRQLLNAALEQTASEYGFIGVVVEGDVLRVLVHEGIQWDATTNREFFERTLRSYKEQGYIEFRNFNNLFGAVVRSGQAVLSNDPANDPRSGGLPPGHPPLRAFLGVPILKSSKVVGIICVANRPGGYADHQHDKLRIIGDAAGVLYESYRRQGRANALEEERKQMMAALCQSQEELEQRVEDRTKQLTETNARLEAEIREREKAEAHIATALREKGILLREIYHRTKNNLQVISSLLDLQAEYVDDAKAKELFQDSQNRICAMALVHEKLFQDMDLARIEVRGYLEDLAATLMQTYQASSTRVAVTVESDDLVWGLDTAVPCGLILNELISNALKHAFPGDRCGHIRVQLRSIAPQQCEMIVSDDGVGTRESLSSTESKSLGIQLVESLVAQMNGAIQLNRERGTEYRIRFQEVRYPQRD